jgi:transglutaminase-like putative cysteine protease
MLLRITHKTKFDYSEPVSDTVFEVRMGPSSDEDQTVLSFDLRVTPNAPLMSYRDGFGNRVDLFNLSATYRELTLETTSLVRTHRRAPADRLAGVDWDGEAVEQSIDALEYLSPSPLIEPCPALDALVATLPRPSGSLLPFIGRVLEGVRGRLQYEKRVTSERTPVSEVLELGRGVCQDFAHLAIGAFRALGVPARYVSGYVNAPGEIATHAWCQVWAGPTVRWVDIDPTSNQFGNDDHVSVALGRDYSDVPPNRGVWKGLADEHMEVSVTVEPMDRVPHAWEDWGPASGRRPHVPGGVRNRTSNGPSRSDEVRDWPAFPNQPAPQALLYRQQGQQQQQQQGS